MEVRCVLFGGVFASYDDEGFTVRVLRLLRMPPVSAFALCPLQLLLMTRMSGYPLPRGTAGLRCRNVAVPQYRKVCVTAIGILGALRGPAVPQSRD